MLNDRNTDAQTQRFNSLDLLYIFLIHRFMFCVVNKNSFLKPPPMQSLLKLLNKGNRSSASQLYLQHCPLAGAYRQAWLSGRSMPIFIALQYPANTENLMLVKAIPHRQTIQLILFLHWVSLSSKVPPKNGYYMYPGYSTWTELSRSMVLPTKVSTLWRLELAKNFVGIIGMYAM